MNPNDIDTPLQSGSQTLLNQSDHDALVEVKVMLRTLIQDIQDLKERMRDMVGQQASALSTWEAKSTAIHDAQEIRLHKLEDFTLQQTPRNNETETRMARMEESLTELQEGRSVLIVGWRTAGVVATIIVGLASFVYAIVNIFTHLKF